MLVLVLLAALVAVGLQRLRLDTSVDTVVPQHSSSLRILSQVQKSFGGDPIVVLLRARAGEQLLGPEQLPRLLQLEGALAALPDVAVVYGPATVLNQVAARAQELLATISGRRDALHDAAVQRALANGASQAQADQAGRLATVGFDRRYGSLLAQGLPAGLPTLRNPTFVHTVAFDGNDRPRAQYRFVIPDASSVVVLVRPRESLSNEGVERLVKRTRALLVGARLPKVTATISGGPVLAAGLAHSVRSDLPRLAVFATVLVGLLFLVAGTGSRRSRLIPLVSAIGAAGLTLAVFGLLNAPIALGMLALLPILLGVGSDFAVYLSRKSDRRTVVVAALASAASFASLGLSPVPFVRGLGLALTLGVLCSVGLGLLLTSRAPQGEQDRAAEAVGALPHRWVVLALVALVAAGGWLLLPSLAVESNPDKIAQGVPELAQVKLAERTLDTSGEVDVVLRGPDVLSPAALAWQNQALASVVTAHGDDLRLVASPSTLLTFLGDKPTSAQISSGVDLLPPYLLGAVVTGDHTRALTSYGVRVADLVQQQALFDDVKRRLPPPPLGYTAAVTGLPVLAAEGYGALSSNRVWPNVLGLGLALVVLLVGLPRRSDAWRALLASALAIGWGLLALRVTDTPLTPLTAALGSLTAAVGCEFLAVAAAAHRVRRADQTRSVLLAAATSTLGYLVLVTSHLAVMRSFGLVLAVSMCLAYASTMLVMRLLPVAVADPARFDPRATSEPTPLLVRTKECT